MRLNKLGWRRLFLSEHSFLDPTDECYFAGEYESSRQHGLKHEILSLKGRNESVILDLAQQLSLALPIEWRTYTFVAMPSCSSGINPLGMMLRHLSVDTRALVVQTRNTLPSHRGWRPMPNERAEFLRLNILEMNPEPTGIVIVDDVLATGAHFRAAKMILRQRWPQKRVIGVFLARVCREPRFELHNR